ncbi:N-acetylmuramoyl-L-alanine amidase family protein [Clostridium frigidicarnis]|uniref:N-acetylmuramoyl-L-alanine amidase n=1 Tax=Clostridium frigidicarnis TaxID=84698 RepID=A0A1I0Z2B1_9CLOT|nr:N-acetylmuramoyl-L-alanine amidase [Clostridium frigidicarnis]SFB18760.1 N-acetylmuramoyl-L-alanine amidase [Clostridium frigidicarnis]
MNWLNLNNNEYIFKDKRSLRNRKIVIVVGILFMGVSTLVYNLTNNTYKPNDESNLSTTKELASISEKESPVPIKMKICIDPGHGGYDPGTPSKEGFYEKDITLSIALMTKNILSKKGVEAVLTRDGDTVSWPSQEKMDLRTRVSICKESNSEAFVSLHCNSSDNVELKGFEVWTKFKNDKGEELAKDIKSSLKEAEYTNDRGIKYREQGSFAVLALNKVPCTLLELGFLSNDDDEKILTSYKGQEKCAEAVARGILSYVESNEKKE